MFLFNSERYISPNVSSLKSLAPLYVSNWIVVWVTFMIIFGICITSLVGWLFFKRKLKELKKDSQQTYDNELCEGPECHIKLDKKVNGIYLVYAKDCNPFMEVMINFRVLLRRLTKCRVNKKMNIKKTILKGFINLFSNFRFMMYLMMLFLMQLLKIRMSGCNRIFKTQILRLF